MPRKSHYVPDEAQFFLDKEERAALEAPAVPSAIPKPLHEAALQAAENSVWDARSASATSKQLAYCAVAAYLAHVRKG